MVYLGTLSNWFVREVVDWSRRKSCLILFYSVTNHVLHCLMGSQVPVKMSVHAPVLWSLALRWYYLGKKKSFFEGHPLGLTDRGRVSARGRNKKSLFLCFDYAWSYLDIGCCTAAEKSSHIWLFLLLLSSRALSPLLITVFKLAFRGRSYPLEQKAASAFPPCWVAKGWDEGEDQRSSKIDKGNSGDTGIPGRESDSHRSQRKERQGDTNERF